MLIHINVQLRSSPSNFIIPQYELAKTKSILIPISYQFLTIQHELVHFHHNYITNHSSSKIYMIQHQFHLINMLESSSITPIWVQTESMLSSAAPSFGCTPTPHLHPAALDADSAVRVPYPCFLGFCSSNPRNTP